MECIHALGSYGSMVFVMLFGFHFARELQQIQLQCAFCVVWVQCKTAPEISARLVRFPECQHSIAEHIGKIGFPQHICIIHEAEVEEPPALYVVMRIYRLGGRPLTYIKQQS